ncbi:hypothetical protein LINPERPRIM_LOCUS35341 [Linum perenne]
MFFRDALRRKLSSLLQPWLLEEPEIEVELGIINSRLTARSLSLDASSLNSFVDGSYRFSLAKVNVELFSLRFSNWSAPALSVEVRGVNVVLSAGEAKEEERLSRARRTSEDAYDDKKKTVAGLDPQGSDVHDLLERFFSTSCSSNSFKTSLLNAVLAHCRLQMFDICLQVQYPSVNDTPMCLAELKSLNAESDNLEGCFIRRLTAAVIRPQKEISFLMDFRGFDIGYRKKDQPVQVFSSADVVVYAKLCDLHLIDFSVHASELNLLLSPSDFPFLSVFVKTFSRKSKKVRNGRQLWRIAANRLRYGTLSLRFSLYNLVKFVCLWLQYLSTYECLLLLVDYADEGSLKMVISKMCKDKMLLNSVKHTWMLISDFEKELPAEYIAQARRIARHRVSMSIQRRQSNYMSSTSGVAKVFSKAFQGLTVIWNFICMILLWLLHCFCFINLFLWKPKILGMLEVMSEDYFPEFCFLVDIGKISITLFPALGSQSANEQVEPLVGISTSDLHSFCLSIEDLLCLYAGKTFEQSMFISCGQVKVNPSCISTSSTESQLKDNVRCDKADKQVPFKYLKSVLWNEPAQTLVQPGTTVGGQVEGACYGFLKEIVGEMWLAWERTCTELDTREVEYSENPWLLCQIKNRLTRSDLNTSNSGFCEYCMTLGKLNLSLGYQSMLSALILCQQVEQALSLVMDGEVVSVLSQTITVQEVQGTDLGIKYELFIGAMKKTLLRMVPEKQIRLGVFITGLDIELFSSQVGLGSDGKNVNGVPSQGGFQLGFDVRSIEVAIWPSSRHDIGFPGSHGVEPKGPRLRDPVIMEFPRIENEKFASHGWVSLGSYMKFNGLNFTVREMVGRQDCAYVALKPITLQLSLFRESVHSFASTVVAFSMASNVTATRFSVFSCMDEVEDLFKVVAGLFSLTYPHGSFDLVGCSHRTYMVSEEADVEGAPLIQSILLCKIESSFSFREIDMILQKARIHDRVEGHIDIEDAFGSEENSVIPDPSSYGIGIFAHQSNLDISCEETKLEVHVHLAEIRSAIFRSEDLMENGSSHSGSYNLVQQAQNCTHEISLPNCKVSVWLSQRNILDKSLEGYSLVNIAGSSHLRNEAEALSIPSYTLSQTSDFTSSVTTLSASYCVIINAELDVLTVSRCSAKKLVTAHQYNKLTSLLLLGGDLRTISLEIQEWHIMLLSRVVLCSLKLKLFHCWANVLLHSFTA